ncbi:unnamed protein product [Lactuca virosa]|uniref:MENTAL domain-containing protein n=1 Tax=Lactuca virosa TaxID=75947 RepID=A0AAU9MB15_9ASTR|nr:unnamed protein product [Lactuca virosa]
MGFLKDERSKKALRGFKTVFFLVTMIISFLFFSAPILFAVADALLPTALLSASLSAPSDSPFPDPSPAFSLLQTLSSHLSNYDFRYSLIDIPLISIIRSAIILCVYGLCDGPGLSRGPYLGITTVCSVVSLLFVSVKASYVFGGRSSGFSAAEVALFICSLSLAIGHIVVAYRTSCRERRKLLVYKIDVEAVSTFKNGFPSPDSHLQVSGFPKENSNLMVRYEEIYR